MAAIGGSSGIFIPKVIQNEAIIAFQNALVYGGLVTTSYESDLASGDQVSIGVMDDPAISDYTDYGDVTHTRATGTQYTLTVDTYKGFDKMISKKDIRQGTPGASLITAVTVAGAAGLGNEVDKSIAGLHSSIATSNTAGTYQLALTSNPATLWEALGAGKRVLYKNKVPGNTPIWAVLSPEVEETVLNDTNLVLRDTPIGDSVFMQGYVGTMRGVNLYVSNNTAIASANHKVMMGTANAIGLAVQVDETDVYVLPGKGNRVWGMSGSVLYGTAIMRPEQLVLLNVDVTTAS